MKRITFLWAALFCSLVTFADTSGTCGDNVLWEYDITTNTLNITGTGEMYDFAHDNWCKEKGYTLDIPWGMYSASIKYVVIWNGVTTIGR